jgi:uncharacterized protein (TIRG00374 family)
VDFGEFTNSLARFRWAYLAPAAFFYLCSFGVRALRWKYMLREKTTLPFSRSFSIIMISFMLNNVLPLRMGEFYRAHLLGMKQSLSRATALASIVLERAFDGLSILAITAIAIASLDIVPRWVMRSFYVSLAGFGSVLLLAFLANRFFQKDKIQRSSLAHEKWRGFILKLGHNFLVGLESVKSVKEMAMLFVFSALVWIPVLVFFYFSILGFDVHLSFMATLLILGFQLLGSMMPNAPGFVGTFEYFTILPLTIMGVDKPTALAIALVMHATSFVPVTAIGLALFLKDKVKGDRDGSRQGV